MLKRGQKLVIYSFKQDIPRHIHKQLLSLNFKSAGLMLDSYLARKKEKSTVFILLEKDRVLSWALSIPTRKGRELQFYTRVSERKKGYSSYIISTIAKKYRTILYFHPAAITIARKVLRIKRKRIKPVSY